MTLDDIRDRYNALGHRKTIPLTEEEFREYADFVKRGDSEFLEKVLSGELSMVYKDARIIMVDEVYEEPEEEQADNAGD